VSTTDLDAALASVRDADQALRDAGGLPLPVTGLEAVVAGAVSALASGDWWSPGPRERAGGVLRGAPVERLADATAGAKPYKIAPLDGPSALRAARAVGIAHATGRCCLVHLGTASTADGAFHEALNLAAALGAPVIFVVAVHPLTGAAPLPTQLHASPAALASAFGLSTDTVDGNSAQAVHDAVRAARDAGGPHLIEATLRPDAPVVAS
jgi:TPP-dependent pyruvate/acetoin dehydrogenase alpha subunit